MPLTLSLYLICLRDKKILTAHLKSATISYSNASILSKQQKIVLKISTNAIENLYFADFFFQILLQKLKIISF